MEWTDGASVFALILSLSVGFCTLFVFASDFFGSFLGIASLVLGRFIVASAYRFLTCAVDTGGELHRRGTATEAERASGAETTTPCGRSTATTAIRGRGHLRAEFERKLERLLETEGRSTNDPASAPVDRELNQLDRELENE